MWVRPFPNRVPEVSRWGTLVPPALDLGAAYQRTLIPLLLSISFFPLFSIYLFGFRIYISFISCSSCFVSSIIISVLEDTYSRR